MTMHALSDLPTRSNTRARSLPNVMRILQTVPAAAPAAAIALSLTLSLLTGASPAVFASALDEDTDRSASYAADEMITLQARRDARDPRDAGWWAEDVWSDPDRPFLYYGVEPEKPRKPANPGELKKPAPESKSPGKPEPPADPEAIPKFETLAQVRAEYDRRLNLAVLSPTDQNLRAFHAMQTWMLGTSHKFAEAFDRVRIADPKFDWTASHPSANFAAVELSSAADRGLDAFVSRLAEESGLIFVGSPDARLNSLAIGPVRAFARESGFELLVIAVDAPVPGDDVRTDNGIVEKLGLSPDMRKLPTVTLVPKPDARHPALAALARGRGLLLAAAGIPSMTELKHRLAVLFAPELEDGNNAQTTHRRTESMAIGDAWSPEAMERLKTRFGAANTNGTQAPGRR